MFIGYSLQLVRDEMDEDFGDDEYILHDLFLYMSVYSIYLYV